MTRTLFAALLAVALTACSSAPEVPEIPGVIAGVLPNDNSADAPVDESGEISNSETAGDLASQPVGETFPLVTVDHQGVVFGPGELVVVVFEGFSPWELLTVNMIHAEQGIIKSSSEASADAQGTFIVFHEVKLRQDSSAYPAGELTIVARGSTGNTQRINFTLDYDKQVQPQPDGCGIYPNPPYIPLGSILIAWCGGHDPAAQTIPLRITTNGTELFSDEAAIAASGLAIALLDILEDDPAGSWTVDVGDHKFQFEVVSP